MAAMANLPTPSDLEILAVKARITVAEACRRAGLVPDVFTRWKRGAHSPTIKNVSKIMDQLSAEIAKNDGAKNEKHGSASTVDR